MEEYCSRRLYWQTVLVGAWLEVNGESIYGTRAARGITTSAGTLTRTDDALYLHLTERPGDTVTFTGIEKKVAATKVLGADLQGIFDEASKTLTMPKNWPDTPVLTFKLFLGQ